MLVNTRDKQLVSTWPLLGASSSNEQFADSACPFCTRVKYCLHCGTSHTPPFPLKAKKEKNNARDSHGTQPGNKILTTNLLSRFTSSFISIWPRRAFFIAMVRLLPLDCIPVHTRFIIVYNPLPTSLPRSESSPMRILMILDDTCRLCTRSFTETPQTVQNTKLIRNSRCIWSPVAPSYSDAGFLQFSGLDRSTVFLHIGHFLV